MENKNSKQTADVYDMISAVREILAQLDIAVMRRSKLSNVEIPQGDLYVEYRAYYLNRAVDKLREFLELVDEKVREIYYDVCVADVVTETRDLIEAQELCRG